MQFKERCGYDINGIWYPRVTSIINIKSNPGLYRFYGELNSFFAGEIIKKQSAAEGTLVHNIVEDLLLGKKANIPNSVKPSIEAFLEFFEAKKIKVEPNMIEKTVVNDRSRYAGTIDAAAFIDGKYGILDIKTSQAIYRDHNLQTAAYMAATQKEKKKPITRWILRIDQRKHCTLCGATLRCKGGRNKIKLNGVKYCRHQWSETRGEIEFKEFPVWRKDFYAFLAAKKLWEWENQTMLKKLGYKSSLI